ncbi:GNAT family N-acetyltransferase [Kocuria sp. M1N1S27]|uniref:GNAT family N-acetyltransferase n=1 Tax=Kocuria kalidii TaxID=3376283 RepID=UPI0037A2BD2A
MIRRPRGHELRKIRALEARAGRLFADLGMDAVADDRPPGVPELREDLRRGLIWVATDDHDALVGYVRTGWIDNAPHLEQVTVDPAFGRRGHGRALVARAEQWGRATGAGRMTLTTFRDVPWNAPYYRRLGWRELSSDAMGPELRAVRAAEAARGLDRWPRTAMVKDL